MIHRTGDSPYCTQTELRVVCTGTFGLPPAAPASSREILVVKACASSSFGRGCVVCRTRRVLRWFAIGSLLLFSACHGLPPPADIPCLSGPVPKVRMAYADGGFRILRERWEALPKLDPLARAALLPTLDTWIPELPYWPAPACGSGSSPGSIARRSPSRRSRRPRRSWRGSVRPGTCRGTLEASTPRWPTWSAFRGCATRILPLTAGRRASPRGTGSRPPRSARWPGSCSVGTSWGPR